MTLTESLIRFTLLATVLAITPGLDLVFVLRQSLRGGRRTAFAATAGICLGALVWGVAAAAGAAALFRASPVAYTVLRWAGVTFLTYLAFTYLRAAIRGDSSRSARGRAVGTAREAFARGLLTDLLNPNMAVFYFSVMPLFLPTGHNPVVAGALLAGAHDLVVFTWFSVVIFAANAVSGFLTSRHGSRAIDGVAGIAILGFGLVLGLQV